MSTISELNNLRQTQLSEKSSLENIEKDINKEHDEAKRKVSAELFYTNNSIALLENLIRTKRAIHSEYINNYSNLMEDIGKQLSKKILQNNLSIKDIQLAFNEYIRLSSPDDFDVPKYPDSQIEKFVLTKDGYTNGLSTIAIASKGYALPAEMYIYGEVMYRPLTFKETVLWQLEDFYTYKNELNEERTIENRLRLWNHPISTITGIENSDKTVYVSRISQVLLNDDNFDCDNSDGKTFPLWKIARYVGECKFIPQNNPLIQTLFEGNTTLIGEYMNVFKDKSWGLSVSSELYHQLYRNNDITFPVQILRGEISLTDKNEPVNFIAPQIRVADK